MFSNLTKYLQLLEDDDFGTLVVDRENDRNQKKTIQMPYVKSVSYTHLVHHNCSVDLEEI